jgi:ferredoxin
MGKTADIHFSTAVEDSQNRCFTILFFLPGLSFLLIAAHFLRWGEMGLSLSCIFMVGAMLWRRFWMRNVAQMFLLLAALRWVATAHFLVSMRIGHGQPWLRMLAILGAVAGVTLLSALIMSSRRIRRWYDNSTQSQAPLAAFVLTASLLGLVQNYLPLPMLLLERYWPGFGWLQVLLMSFYAAWLTEKFLYPSVAACLRPRIWLLFSVVFFAQLFLGLAGFKEMLMTGKLHLPVPALIIAGPLYRGRDFFMPILFVATLLLVGPAWCSHLCYFGAWDSLSSRSCQVPGHLPAYAAKIRFLLLVLVSLTALLLRYLYVGWLAAAICAALFGLAGIAVMLVVSRRNGVMTHCVSFCPAGLLGNWIGRLSPFRMRIAAGCVECQVCRKACRYNALHLDDIRSRRPGSTCTLCGDCISACHSGQIGYSLPWVSSQSARTIFLALIISLHAIFMAVARI